jgi:hypothetical protein
VLAVPKAGGSALAQLPHALIGVLAIDARPL